MIVAGKYQISPKTGQDHEKHHKLAWIMKDIPQNWPGSWHGPEPWLDTGPLGHDAAAIVPHPRPSCRIPGPFRPRSCCSPMIMLPGPRAAAAR
jgi:hypothetical protein